MMKKPAPVSIAPVPQISKAPPASVSTLFSKGVSLDLLLSPEAPLDSTSPPTQPTQKQTQITDSTRSQSPLASLLRPRQAPPPRGPPSQSSTPANDPDDPLASMAPTHSRDKPSAFREPEISASKVYTQTEFVNFLHLPNISFIDIQQELTRLQQHGIPLTASDYSYLITWHAKHPEPDTTDRIAELVAVMQGLSMPPTPYIIFHAVNANLASRRFDQVVALLAWGKKNGVAVLRPAGHCLQEIVGQFPMNEIAFPTVMEATRSILEAVADVYVLKTFFAVFNFAGLRHTEFQTSPLARRLVLDSISQLQELSNAIQEKYRSKSINSTDVAAPKALLLPLCFAIQSTVLVRANLMRDKLIKQLLELPIGTQPGASEADAEIALQHRQCLPYVLVMDITRKLHPGDTERVERIFNLIEEDGFVPDDMAFAQLLRVHISTNDISAFRQIIQRIRTSGVSIDNSLAIQTALLSYWLKMDHPENTTSVLERILALQLAPAEYSHLRREVFAGLKEYNCSEIYFTLARLAMEPLNPESIVKKQTFLQAIQPYLTEEQHAELHALVELHRTVPRYKLAPKS